VAPAPLRRRILGSPTLAGMALLVPLLAGCGSSGSSDAAAASGPSASAGSLTLSGARVPQPASPDVGVAYFTLTNSGTSTDRLVAAASSVSRSAMPMRDVTQHGASAMVDVKSLVVPADGSIELTPGGTHLMLQRLTRTLAVGDTVVLHLRFAHAGPLTVRVPVTAITGASEPSDMSSMPGM
jgi:copper(I)-binding protein